MVPPAAPFVLLDDARPGGGATLYSVPREIVRADGPGEVEAALERIRAAVARGRHAAGWLAYEAGYVLEPRLAALASAVGGHPAPLLWFGLFDRAEPLDAAGLAAFLPDANGAWAGQPRPTITRDAYGDAFARVASLIAAGDIYQANLSFRADVPVAGHPLALYARLRGAAGAGWGGVVHDGERWLLSCSPELFFRIEGREIEAHPMKGTRPRGVTPAADDALAAELAADPKERAENLMIVDLLRNDLARVAEAGSVRVPALFAVERYPTVLQMVSRVAARLAPARDPADVLRALFPCGSITGAPKIRAMEVIAAVEADARGAYSGAIGAWAPDGAAAFNVAIRTLTVEENTHVARIGLGSAVVADSEVESEWRECLAKAAFVTAAGRPFDLLETMRFDPDAGLIALDLHIERLGASARAFDFRFNRHDVRNELHAATFRLRGPSRVRLRLSPGGTVAIEAAPLPPAPDEPVTVALVPLPVHPSDFRLRHKTSDRSFYDAARAAAGTFEVAIVHPAGVLTEGSFTSLFHDPGDGMLVTPPLARGLQPGILRRQLLESGRAREGELTPAALAEGTLHVGNALRGLLRARIVRETTVVRSESEPL